jgi:hypothetical protein
MAIRIKLFDKIPAGTLGMLASATGCWEIEPAFTCSNNY